MIATFIFAVLMADQPLIINNTISITGNSSILYDRIESEKRITFYYPVPYSSLDGKEERKSELSRLLTALEGLTNTKIGYSELISEHYAANSQALKHRYYWMKFYKCEFVIRDIGLQKTFSICEKIIKNGRLFYGEIEMQGVPIEINETFQLSDEVEQAATLVAIKDAKRKANEIVSEFGYNIHDAGFDHFGRHSPSNLIKLDKNVTNVNRRVIIPETLRNNVTIRSTVPYVTVKAQYSIK